MKVGLHFCGLYTALSTGHQIA
ncbi:hypothetical protein NXF25_013966 [Crotalus adamanteus]|uniref:Uncharacterized protein n=1 Tax=Crotalus adamanteus TaxID=8729 RepID=A0AAW1BBY6_CROAD